MIVVGSQITIHMKTINIIATFIITLASTSAFARAGSDPASQASDSLPSLVEVEWLKDHLRDPDIVILDCTVKVSMDEAGFKMTSGRENYQNGHIPSAGFVDLLGNLSDLESPNKYALPKPEIFAKEMGKMGIGDTTRVVLYSAGRPDWATRVWWMLKWIGFDNAAILNGGPEAWTAAGLPLSIEPFRATERQLSVKLRPHIIAEKNDVASAIKDHATCLIDAMPEAHYKGEFMMYERPGHISGAVNIPSSSLLDDSGRYLPKETLEEMYKIGKEDRAITYCGGGISATSTAFVMDQLGYTDVAVYIASLQEWTADPDAPMQTDE